MEFSLLAVTPAPWNYLLGWTLSLLALFLSLLILVQRGRGGGLTGALGGMGGQSAFGTKAGDLFTRVTIGVATVWILLSMLAIKMLNPSAGKPVFDRTEITLPSDATLKKDLDRKNSDGGALPVEGADPAATVPGGDAKDSFPAAPTKEAGDDKAPPTAEGNTGDSPAAEAPKASAPKDDAPAPEKSSDEKGADPAKSDESK